MKDEEWIWYNKKYITSIEYEYFNDKSGDRGVTCSILHIQMQAKKKNSLPNFPEGHQDFIKITLEFFNLLR